MDAQGQAWADFKSSNGSRMKVIEDELGSLLKSQGRKAFIPGQTTPTTPTQSFYDIKSKQRVPCLDHKDSLAALGNKTDGAPSVGRLLRGIILGGRADDAAELADERKALGTVSDPSGGYTLAGELSSTWIDALRANMVLSKAGAITIPMQSKELSLAKITGDASSYWHAENTALTESAPTFGAINLQAKTVATIVKMSLELAADSENIEAILQSTLVSAMAAEIDRAGLVGSATGAGAAPLGLFNAVGRNSVLSVGAPTSFDFLVDALYELQADNTPAGSNRSAGSSPCFVAEAPQTENRNLRRPDPFNYARRNCSAAEILDHSRTAHGLDS